MQQQFLMLVTLMLSAAVRGEVSSPHGPLELDCARCHSTTGWGLRVDTPFDHGIDTSWPLAGAHQQVACTACHVGARFRDTGGSCLDCHLDPHMGSLGNTCMECHGPERWIDTSRFLRVHDRGRFPLIGAHRQLSCASCHLGTGAAQFMSAPNACQSCHMTDYLATSQPNHLASGLGTECEDCHGATRWTETPGFRHARFPLTGAHTTISCLACHVNGQYIGIPNSCYGCHQQDFEQASNPNHVDGQFSQACSSCHTATAWRPAMFDHSSTDFPLTGAHQVVPCASCHVGGQFTNTPADCYFCHELDYLSASEPNHVSADFPVQCASCHTTNSWEGASFNHDGQYFPIYSGSHRGEWNSCVDCHTESGDYHVFSCIDCHEHRQSEMDGEHDGVRDYVYASLACLECHADGRSEESTRPRFQWRSMDEKENRNIR